MDSAIFGTVFKIMQVISTLVDLGVAGVALGVAIYCVMKRISVAASWILFGGWVLFVICDISFLVNDFILARALGHDVTRWIGVILSLFNLLAGIVFAFSIAMFKKPANLQAGEEAAHV
jgi:hypothetical protein